MPQNLTPAAESTAQPFQDVPARYLEPSWFGAIKTYELLAPGDGWLFAFRVEKIRCCWLC